MSFKNVKCLYHERNKELSEGKFMFQKKTLSNNMTEKAAIQNIPRIQTTEQKENNCPAKNEPRP